MLLSLFTMSFTVLIILIIMLYRSAKEKDLGLNIYRSFDINNRKTLYFTSDEFNFREFSPKNLKMMMFMKKIEN